MAGNEVFDADKVEAIKLAIADGKFQIDSSKVTAGLLQSVKDLLQTRKN
jgi:negative regulator of flagellin synthesis FlgM